MYITAQSEVRKEGKKRVVISESESDWRAQRARVLPARI